MRTFLLLTLAALFLSGCEPTPTAETVQEQCRLQAMTAYGASYDRQNNYVLFRFFTTCMSTKGWELDPKPGDDCRNMALEDRALVGGCYRQRKWWHRYVE